MKKIIISISVVIILLLLGGAAYLFVGNSYEQESIIKRRIDFEEIEEKILKIIEVEIKINGLDFEDSGYFNDLKDILTEHSELIEILNGDIGKHLEEYPKSNETLLELNKWIQIKQEQNTLSTELGGDINKLKTAFDDESLEKNYTTIVLKSEDLRNLEFDSLSHLLVYRDLRLDEDDDDFLLDDYIVSVQSLTNNEESVEIISSGQDGNIPASEEQTTNSINKDTLVVDTDSTDSTIEHDKLAIETRNFPPAYKLERGHDDRYPLAIAICHYDGISEEDLIFLRHMASDEEYAFIIASPGNNTQAIRQYCAKKTGDKWIVLAGYDAIDDVRMLIPQEFPDFNINTLPDYDLKNYTVGYWDVNTQTEVFRVLIDDGYVTGDTYIYLLSQVNDYAFIFFKDNTRLLLRLESGEIESVQKLDYTNTYASYYNYLPGGEPPMLFLQD